MSAPRRFTLTMADYCLLHADFVALQRRAAELDARGRSRCAVAGCELGHWRSPKGEAIVLELLFPGIDRLVLVAVCDQHHEAVAGYVQPPTALIGALLVDLVVLVVQQARSRPGWRHAA